VYLRRDGFVLELLAFTEPAPLDVRDRPLTEPGLTHISIGVDDLDATCTAVIAHGGEVLDETRLANAVFVRDCEGQLVELLAGDGFARRLHSTS
jgi:catechol 2,3-dioxygenase-like lactoylglutathione lyase family enzyme